MIAEIFFCNGFMSAMTSCLIADRLKEQDPQRKIILCIEQNTHVSTIYYEILNLLISKCNSFYAVIPIECKLLTATYSKPILYIKSVRYYKKIGFELKKKIEAIGIRHMNEIWASTTSRLWPVFKKSGVVRNLIEHGMGEYLTLNSPNAYSLKSGIKYLVGLVLGYPDPYRYDKAYLTCDFLSPDPSRNVEVINCSGAVGEYIDNFWNSYRLVFSDAYLEIQQLASHIKKSVNPVYMYIPSDEVRIEEYSKYLAEQLAYFDIHKDATFLIKRHPGLSDLPYMDFFPVKERCRMIKRIENTYIPVEFIVGHLGVKHVIGSCSTSLYYIKSWIPDVNLLTYNSYNPDIVRAGDIYFLKQMIISGLFISPGKKRSNAN